MPSISLGELIAALRRIAKEDPGRVFRPGFGDPHSHRGDYSEVAFEPVPSATVHEMLAHAESALGATFTGWKGGEYTMDEFTEVHIAEHGNSADLIWYFWLGIEALEDADGS